MTRTPKSTAADATAFETAAAPVWRFLDDIDEHARDGERELARRCNRVLAEFSEALLRAGQAPTAIPPARFALAVLIDQRARELPSVRIGPWAAAAQVELFDGRDMSGDTIRGFLRTAEGAGEEYTPLAQFLGRVLTRIEGKRRKGRTRTRSGWAGWAALAAFLLVGVIAGYAVFLEQRFQARLWAAFEVEALEIGLDRAREGADLVARLDRLSAAVERLESAVEAAPLGRVVRLPYFDSVAPAREAYAQANASQVPRELARRLNEDLATEGDSLRIYDTLRAMAVLDGDADWAPAYLAGWIADREDALGMPGLSRHAGRLAGPPATPPAWDGELVDQAKVFAAEVVEPDRAYLEMLRSEGAAALREWVPTDAVMGLGEVMTRRSGLDLSRPISGVFTAAGWTWARDFGSGTAVQRAREEGPALLGSGLPRQNDTPDRLMDRLQIETVATWKDWLADLRVKPFSDRASSVRVSGALAQRASPLSALLTEVWVQAGGTDRGRAYEHQIRLATEFGPMIQYVEQGRMSDIAALFGALNVALASFEFDEERGAERLMSVQERSQSVAALQVAPRIVVQIVEDVLAQTSAAHSSAMGNPLNRLWQRLIFPACKGLTDGRYPFFDGPDADLAAFEDLLAPGGTLDRFFRANAERYIDAAATPWRWKPEARFAGLTLETAEFFQRALAIGQAYFDKDGALGTDLLLAALAERGQALMAIGGQAVPVRATGDPETLAWPGPSPATGAEVSFQDGAASTRITQPGPWGLLRLLDDTRLRPRNEGRRFLVDLRAETGRLFLEINLGQTMNPISGRALLSGFSCPPAL